MGSLIAKYFHIHPTNHLFSGINTDCGGIKDLYIFPSTRPLVNVKFKRSRALVDRVFASSSHLVIYKSKQRMVSLCHLSRPKDECFSVTSTLSGKWIWS
jgi:hypothetical protein